MKEYLFLFRGGDKPETPEAGQDHMQRWMEWMTSLSKEGKFISAQPLDRNGKKISGTKKMVTDGPFMEGKEMVGGYLICKADSIDEAVEISKRCPLLEYDSGTIEVREIQELKM